MFSTFDKLQIEILMKNSINVQLWLSIYLSIIYIYICTHILCLPNCHYQMWNVITGRPFSFPISCDWFENNFLTTLTVFLFV